jgi:putative GTP pyrophosphokinase
MQNMEKRFVEKMKLPDIPEEFEESFETIREMFTLYICAVREVNTKLENLNQEFEFRKERNPIQYIDYRIKSPQSILEKMKRNHLEMSAQSLWNNICDVAGIRVICSYINDIYAIAGMLTRQDDVILLQQKDYIKNPKESGYRSLHLIIETPVFLSDKKHMVKVEVQIRTIAMDFWASLEHQLRYKADMDVPDSVRERLKKSAENIYHTDLEMEQIFKEIWKVDEKTEEVQGEESSTVKISTC